MHLPIRFAAACAFILFAGVAAAQTPHNVILFVPDGLRALKVTPETAPAMAAVRDKGVNFKRPHSLFPTFTMPNSSGLSTGHYLGDTGVFSNTIYAGYPVAKAGDSVTPFLENDPILGDIDEHYTGNYVDEDTILKAARDQGFSTAAVGKLGPTLMFDHTERSGAKTIIVDDQTGSAAGIPLSDEVKAAMQAAGLSLSAPSRGDNGKAGDFKTPGTTTANFTQQAYFADVAAKVVLPMFEARNKPFVLVLWSRDPDGSQHNQGDSLNALTPGINGPTSLAAIKNADDNLAYLQQALKELGLAETTDIVVAADHGFSTISKESKTSPAAKGEYADVVKGSLPPGFVALDLAKYIQTLDNSLIYKEITKEEYIVLAKEYDVVNKNGFNLAQMAVSVPGSLMLGDKSYLLVVEDNEEKLKIKNFIINLHEGKNTKRVITQIKKRLDCDVEIIDNKIVVNCNQFDLDQIVEIKSILSIELDENVNLIKEFVSNDC